MGFSHSIYPRLWAQSVKITAATEGAVRGRGGQGGGGWAEAQREAEAVSGGCRALVGLPTENIMIGGRPFVWADRLHSSSLGHIPLSSNLILRSGAVAAAAHP
jgi:hypothetical protein